MKAASTGENRFAADARRYAEYLETPEGRLRADLTFANLEDFLPAAPRDRSLAALDLGCGTGAAAIRLARLGIQATLLDSSTAMLNLAERAIVEAGVSDRATVKHGDASGLAILFPEGAFDFILCHNVLEFVEDPDAVVCAAARLLRDSSSVLSVLVRNQAGEVLKAALLLGDLGAAERNLNEDWGQESLYGGKVRLFRPEGVERMLKNAGLVPAAQSAVRVMMDYMPPQILRSAEYDRIFALERKLGRRQEFFGMGRYLQYLARPAEPAPKGAV